jgi:hypothetical protein
MIVERQEMPDITCEGMEYCIEKALEIPNLQIETKVGKNKIRFQFPYGKAVDMLFHNDEAVQLLFPQRKIRETDGAILSMQYIRRMQKLAEELDMAMGDYLVSSENGQPFFQLVPLANFRFSENGENRNLPVDAFILSQFLSSMIDTVMEGLKTKGDKVYSLAPNVKYPISLYKEDDLEEKGGFNFYLLVADEKTVEELKGEE